MARPFSPSVLAAVALAAGAALAGCNKTREPDGSTTSGSPGSASSASPGSAPARRARPTAPTGPTGPAEVGWDAPGAWTHAEKAGAMRKATYFIPKAPGDPEQGEMSVSQAGGTVDQNIARWALQLDRKLGDVKRTPRTVNGLTVTVVEIHGDYLGMLMPGGAAQPPKKPGFALLGAIVDTSPPTFFKLVGPEKTVVAAQRDFDKMVDSLHAK